MRHNSRTPFCTTGISAVAAELRWGLRPEVFVQVQQEPVCWIAAAKVWPRYLRAHGPNVPSAVQESCRDNYQQRRAEVTQEDRPASGDTD
jgi:hypothetical protein